MAEISRGRKWVIPLLISRIVGADAKLWGGKSQSAGLGRTFAVRQLHELAVFEEDPADRGKPAGGLRRGSETGADVGHERL